MALNEMAKLSEEDQKLMSEFLASDASAFIELPPPATQLALFREQFAMWNNSYLATCTNLQVAHDAGIADLEARYFQEAKQYRVAVQTLAARIDGFLKEHPELDTPARLSADK